MKKRLGGISTTGGASAERPFFDVSVELTVPRVTMNPTLDDIQAAINATAKKVIFRLAVLHCVCNNLPAVHSNCSNSVLAYAVRVVIGSAVSQEHAVISNYRRKLCRLQPQDAVAYQLHPFATLCQAEPCMLIELVTCRS